MSTAAATAALIDVAARELHRRIAGDPPWHALSPEEKERVGDHVRAVLYIVCGPPAPVSPRLVSDSDVLELIRARGECTRAEIADVLKVSPMTAASSLRELTARGVLQMIVRPARGGPGRPGHHYSLA